MATSKSEVLKQMLLKKKKCNQIAMDVLQHLIEPDVQKEYLLEKAGLIQTSHWDDIIEERQITGVCGWVLCNERLRASPKQQYIIRKHKVLDITDRKKYCSSLCYGASQHFRRQIPESPLWVRDEELPPKFDLVTDYEPCKAKHVSLDGIEVRLTSLNISSSSSDSDKDDAEDEPELQVSRSER